MKKGYFFSIILLFLFFFIITSCQPTPKTSHVTQKDGTLDQKIKEQETSPAPNEHQPFVYQYEKTYENGIKIMIDAPLYDEKQENLPVLTIEKDPFTDGMQIETISRSFIPTEGIYDYTGALTKQQIEKEILRLREYLYRLDAGLPVFPEDTGPTPPEHQDALRQSLEGAINHYEQQYATAPDETLIPTTFTLKNVRTNDYQANMYAYVGEKTYDLDFINNELGNFFYFTDTSAAAYDPASGNYSLPAQVSQNDTLSVCMETAALHMKNIGIEDMHIDTIYQDKTGYTLYYTRAYNGLQETYIPTNFDVEDVEMGEAEYANLWRNEFLSFRFEEAALVKVSWSNRAKIKAVDNENVKTLSWAEVESIFLTQLDYMFSPKEMGEVFEKDTTIQITRIALGFAKIRMKDQPNVYKLVPAWSFIGTEASENSTTVQNEVCFVTINAVDGSIVNRNMMY